MGAGHRGDAAWNARVVFRRIDSPMDIETYARVIRSHLQAVLGGDEFDVAAGDDGTLDVATDHWTVHLEAGGGFLAIDDEPEEPAQFAAARRKVLNEKVERALALADRELGGAITAALTASGDPFTLDLVAARSKHTADE